MVGNVLSLGSTCIDNNGNSLARTEATMGDPDIIQFCGIAQSGATSYTWNDILVVDQWLAAAVVEYSGVVDVSVKNNATGGPFSPASISFIFRGFTRKYYRGILFRQGQISESR